MIRKLSERVRLGTAWLDANDPGWDGRINVDRLNLADPCWCILGQLGSCYNEHPLVANWSDQRLSRDALACLGFEAAAISQQAYARLTAAWRNAILARREVAA